MVPVRDLVQEVPSIDQGKEKKECEIKFWRRFGMVTVGRGSGFDSSEIY